VDYTDQCDGARDDPVAVKNATLRRTHLRRHTAHAKAIPVRNRAGISWVGVSITIQLLSPPATAARSSNFTTVPGSVAEAVARETESLHEEGACRRRRQRSRTRLMALQAIRKARTTRLPVGAVGLKPAETDTHRLRPNDPTTCLYIGSSRGFLTSDATRGSGKRMMASISQ
jgi:hypothetical protein